MTTCTPPVLTESLLAGDRQAVSRAISRIERGGADAGALRAALAPHLGRAHVVGLTGAPGAGKSTLVNALLGALLEQGRRVGVVAVDPSSPISGGALLGDRVRMGEHGAHPRVFVRSVASRGHLGGLSQTTAGVVDLLDAAGFDPILVETVGAGQSEVEVARLADTCIVACPPGLGDEVQAIKAGILEIADLLVVTKSDLPGARSTARDLRVMTHLRKAAGAGGWQTPVLGVTATTGDGIAALVERIEAHGAAVGRGRRRQRDVADAAQRAADAAHAAPDARGGALARSLGIEIGAATATLRVRAAHLDASGACDRSVIFALADCAARVAAGAQPGGAEAHITTLRAAHEGDELVASVSRAAANGWSVDVVDREARRIAVVTGSVRGDSQPGA